MAAFGQETNVEMGGGKKRGTRKRGGRKQNRKQNKRNRSTRNRRGGNMTGVVVSAGLLASLMALKKRMSGSKSAKKSNKRR